MCIKAENTERKMAIIQLMNELRKGRRSGEEEGYIPAREVREIFHNRKK